MSAVGRKPLQHHHHIPHSVPQFPTCVNEVLTQISVFAKQHENKWARAKGSDLQTRIDAELFCIGADRRFCRLSELQKFKLMGMLCTFFSQEEMKNASLRHLHFDIIFCGREGETVLHEIRINFLIKLCAMAIQYPVFELFEDVSQWLFKIGNGKLYAEKFIGELVDSFILVPESYKLYEYLFPLRTSAVSFAYIFFIFSVTKVSLNVALVAVFNKWLNKGFDEFFALFQNANYHQFAEVFANETFGLLLRYDCKNARKDEEHHFFHYIVSQFLIQWRPISKLKSSSGFGVHNLQTRVSVKSHQLVLVCDALFELTLDFNQLPPIGCERFLDNLENALRAEKLKFEDLKISDDLRNYCGFVNRFAFFLQDEK